ncbi:GSCOCG00011881001-RA-CDS, partial [Cotesia congregata]
MEKGEMYRAPPSRDDSYVAECAYPRSSRSDRRKTHVHAVADDTIPEKPAKRSTGGRKSRSRGSRAAPIDPKADDCCLEEEVTAVSAEETKTRKPNEDKSRDLRRRLRFCFNCGETDHFVWTCPNPHRDICPRCGTLGLTAITCTC